MELTDSFPHPAIELRSGFHGPDLPDIRGDRHGLDHLSASPLRDRSHRVCPECSVASNARGPSMWPLGGSVR